MGATWSIARAAVRRRRGQTVLIGVIVTLCTAALLIGIALLAAVTGPFDRTFAQLHGAHATVLYDSTKITDDRVGATAQADGVVAASGPFPMASAQLQNGMQMGAGPMRIAGRAEPGGGADQLRLTHGRWATATGEIVVGTHLRWGPDPGRILGRTYTLPNLGTATVVGVAYSVTQSADAWMRPDDVRRIGATSTQMLYRFAPESAATAAHLEQRLAAVTAGVPTDAVAGTGDYLTNRERAGQRAKTLSSFLTVFAVLSLIVAVLVIGNVVSGAVIAGYRSIGVLKAIGFTPGQVTAVYLLMMTGPALIGCAVGAVLGNLGTSWLLEQFQNNVYVLGLDTTPSPVLTVAVLVAVPVLVAVTALVPALRAGRTTATAALSAVASPTGRGRAVQRLLSRSRLPRAVSLGLALPVVRPARTLLTLLAVVLGSATVVFSIGLTESAGRWNDALVRADHVQVQVMNPPPGGPTEVEGEARRQPEGTRMTDPEVEAFVRGIPGARYVTTLFYGDAAVAGITENVDLNAYRGDSAQLGYEILEGRWISGAGEAAVGAEVLRLTGKSIGDSLTLTVEGRTVVVRIVGEIFGVHSEVYLDWASVSFMEPRMPVYFVGLSPGTTADRFIEQVAGGGDAGLIATTPDDDEIDMAVLLSVVGALTAALLVVAGLGVAHTAVLNTRERRRDLAIVKSVGMTPAQAAVMVVTSMAALGILGGVLGLPGGVAAQRQIIQLIGEAAGTRLPQGIVDVYTAPQLAVLLLSGVLIAVLSALLPARQAARISTAEALHTE
ncbi:FtsX family ABC transporter permease [Catellatospora sichuanensis]|uniref:FtsX family ABC transporter permease n=1 Tax=Catellatospora sichuanensis TaxID=1969805 RepID=UPI0011823E2E|nr:FtsX family ABC transporter permease [Catellatospora sichuanensis]